MVIASAICNPIWAGSATEKRSLTMRSQLIGRVHPLAGIFLATLWPHRLVAQDAGLSRLKLEFKSPWGHHAAWPLYCERGWICKLNYHRRNQISRLVSLQPSWRRVICGFVICNRNSNKENESKLTLYSLVGELESPSPCHGEDRGFESRRGCHIPM